MDSIKNILPKSLKKAGLTQKVAAALVVESFSEVADDLLGKKISGRVQALYLKDKILTIACLSSVVAQELQLNQNKVINRINKKFDEKMVEKLRFLT